MIRSAIIGCGSYTPEKVMKNSDFEGVVETSDAWIVQRTGIRERDIAADGARYAVQLLVGGRHRYHAVAWVEQFVEE